MNFLLHKEGSNKLITLFYSEIVLRNMRDARSKETRQKLFLCSKTQLIQAEHD